MQDVTIVKLTCYNKIYNYALQNSNFLNSDIAKSSQIALVLNGVCKACANRTEIKKQK